MSDSIRAALERLIKDTEYLVKGGEDLDCAWAAIAAARAALASPGFGLPQRPKSFELALDFLGGPETDELRAYVEQLEARAALAEPVVPATGATPRHCGPHLCWTENLPPSESCPYDHCIAETPFGRFLITWKSWKEYDSPIVDETPWSPWGAPYDAFNSINEAKAACQRGFDQRLARCGHPALALNQVFAGPTTGTDVNTPHFRFLTANDLPKQQVEIERLETPPPEGEVGKLIQCLQIRAASLGVEGASLSQRGDAAYFTRAAELLQQQQAELQECGKVAAAFEKFNQQRSAND